MKLEEVPQDEAFLIEGKIRDMCYVLDKDGKYTRALSKGWSPKNDAMRLAWDQIYEQAADIRLQVLDGKASPIAFYMQLNVMDEHILATYVELSRRKVRRHLKMKHFLKLSDDLLARYALALNITPAELVNVERIRTIVFAHED
jgi:hypothetical protein